MTTVTSKTGKQIALSITGASVVAQIGGVSFQVDRTASGMQSRWLVSEFGNRRVEIQLEGDNLAQAHALFAELTTRVSTLAAEQAEYDARAARVLRGMGG